jgi:hypothetical protein
MAQDKVDNGANSGESHGATHTLTMNNGRPVGVAVPS